MALNALKKGLCVCDSGIRLKRRMRDTHPLVPESFIIRSFAVSTPITVLQMFGRNLSKSGSFLKVFQDAAESFLMQHPRLRSEWKHRPNGCVSMLRFFKNSSDGFDAGVHVRPQGLYPFAGDWRGVPWKLDSPFLSVAEMCAHSLELIHALLTDETRLRVKYAGGRPYKWCVEVATPDGWMLHEEAGSLIFPFFLARSTWILFNNQLPPLGFASGHRRPDSLRCTSHSMSGRSPTAGRSIDPDSLHPSSFQHAHPRQPEPMERGTAETSAR